jgi:hypothetical protein
VQTVFRSTTLRSMLLEAYGFWQMGQIALFAEITSFTGAGLLLILSVLGLVHGPCPRRDRSPGQGRFAPAQPPPNRPVPGSGPLAGGPDLAERPAGPPGLPSAHP